MSEENKAIARRFINELNEGNLAVFDELLAPDFVDHSPLPGAEPTREGWKRALAAMELDPFPDLEFQIEDQIAEGDRVVTRSTGHGTHQGEFMGIPATGKEVVASNITIFRIADDKIIERWTVFDGLGVMAQLGAISPPGESRG